MKAVITVLGKDTIGIIAGVSQALAEEKINILDIRQTIMGEIFSMFMMVDVPENADFAYLNDKFDNLGEKLGVRIQITQEKIFDSMHRI